MFSPKVISFIAFFLVVIFLAGCGVYSDFFTTLREDVKPRVKLIFRLYFGVDEQGNYLTESNPDATGDARGVQDLVAARLDEFPAEDREELKEVDESMKKALGRAKSINSRLEKFRGNADELMDNLDKILTIGVGVYEKVED